MFRRFSGAPDPPEDQDASGPPGASQSAIGSVDQSPSLLSGGLNPMERIITRIYSARNSGSNNDNARLHLTFSTEREAAAEQNGATSPTGVGTSVEVAASPQAATDTSLEDAEAGIPHRRPTVEEESLDVTENAERVRLTAPNISVDLRQAVRSAESTLPFVLLIIIVFTLHHLVSISIFGYCTWVLHRCNIVIQDQVARRGALQRGPVFACFALLMVHAVVIDALGLSGKIWKVLSMTGVPQGRDFWDILFTAGLADLFLRTVVSAAKALVIVFSSASSQPQCRRRGGILTALDYSGAALRSVLPAPLWIGYFRASRLTTPVGLGLSGIYLLFKAANVLDRVTLAMLALGQWQGTQHGQTPTQEDLAAAPTECSICQDDLRDPLKLSCGHIFCGQCIGEWLDREATCPMCRSVVRRAALRPRNDGASTLLPLLC